jgi:CubicO group peptidase (beta-lactamase class C family)
MHRTSGHRTARFAAYSAIVAIATLVCRASLAAPDEELLGKAEGYPIGHTRQQAYQPKYIVGSFSAMDQIEPSCALAPSTEPRVLKQAQAPLAITYRFQEQTLTLDDYFQRQRVTAALVLKDGEIVAERYNYARTPDMRMLSNSMAKTIVALALGKAREEGLIKSFDDTAATYVPQLAGTLYGGTRLVNLMRMASGARYIEEYSKDDDRARFNALFRSNGTIAAARSVSARAEPEGEKFNYAGAQTQVLGLVLRAATGKSLCDYVDEKLWRPLGAEAKATWLINQVDQVEIASGDFNATVRDYARLGAMLADDGKVGGQDVVLPDTLRAMTDPDRQPEAFRPGHMDYQGHHYFGYGLQVWLLPGSHHQFALLGIYGQAIYVDPVLKLVMVHTAVGKDAAGDASGNHLGAEREALWHGLVTHYGGQ